MRNFLSFLILFVSLSSFGQELITDNEKVNDAFKLANQTVEINIRRGVLAAGGDYGGEWTRDIAINSWNSVSLFLPEVAEQSLWSVTIDKDKIGHQYWDKIIWTIAAYNHYLINGDKKFLKQAYLCSANTMTELEGKTFDSDFGMFNGGAVFQDGIAGYPEPIYEPGNHSGGVEDHKGSYTTKTLSTNCVYYGAYIALAEMAKVLKENDDVIESFSTKAKNLKASILKHLYNPEENTISYLIDQNGKVHNYQEGIGVSFAVILGIVEGEQAQKLIENANVSKYGIVAVSPNFARYSKEMPGRHNELIWPFINGFFAQASVLAKDYKSFENEFYGLTSLAIDKDKGDYNFREIFNPISGKPDGGHQDWGPERPNYHWDSCKQQTWSATGYISMVLKGLIGMSFSEEELTFSPYLPANLGDIQLNNLKYRNANLNITVKGKGNTIKSFKLDGKKQSNFSIPSSIKGEHSILISLKE